MQVLELDLDVYQGPFDLLFTLIVKEEVDICEVPLLEVILAYLEHAVAQNSTDWEGLTDFVLLISSLLELKSRVLLPSPHVEEEEPGPEDAREQLLERLIRYHRFKRAAEALTTAWQENRGRLLRPADRPRRKVPATPETIADTQDPAALASSLRALLERRRGPDTSHVHFTRVDLTRQLSVLRRLLVQEGRISFDAAFGAEEPMVQAVTLFALLELLADGQVRVSQPRPFADIAIRRRETGTRRGRVMEVARSA